MCTYMYHIHVLHVRLTVHIHTGSTDLVVVVVHVVQVCAVLVSSILSIYV